MKIIKTFEDLSIEYYVCTRPVTDEERAMGIFQCVHGSYATIEEAENMVRKVREYFASSSRVECMVTDAFPDGAKIYIENRIPNDENNLLKHRHKNEVSE